MVMGVPQPLRQQNLQQLLPDLLSYAVLSEIEIKLIFATVVYLADKSSCISQK